MNSEPIHEWFNLTYSSYLVLQRTLLQSMPEEWQERFVKCLTELDAAFTDELNGECFEYWVRRRHGRRFIHDPYADYERGRRRVKVSGSAGVAVGDC